MANRFFVLRQFFLAQGAQPERLHSFLSKALVPALQASGKKVLVLEVMIAEHMPQVALLMGMESMADWQKIGLAGPELARFIDDWNAWETDPAGKDEPPYLHYSETLLGATPYSPDLEEAAPGAPGRVFEMRVYHSPTWRQLRALHARFAGPEIPIFHRCGVHPVVYLETMAGPNMPNLTYFIPFENLAAREAAWSKFRDDPEWLRVRKESTDQHGQIAARMSMTLWKATAYSPVR
jgi:hypothetical protein